MTNISKKVSFIIEYFNAFQPDVKSELQYSSAYELLVATILAAQCTDKRVNMVTPALFAKYPKVEDLSKASDEDVLTYISSISYPNSKSKHLVEMAKMVVEDFDSQIPSNMEELIKLPGVGRKTANVVLAFAFNKAAMPVDTHVFRVSHRLGLTTSEAKTPELVEKSLLQLIPAEYVSRAHHWLLLHGRYVCTARNPHCAECALIEICDFEKHKK